MSVIHGTWVTPASSDEAVDRGAGFFFLWGEMWRSAETWKTPQTALGGKPDGAAGGTSDGTPGDASGTLGHPLGIGDPELRELRPHPFAMSIAELTAALADRQPVLQLPSLTTKDRTGRQTIAIPTQVTIDHHCYPQLSNGLAGGLASELAGGLTSELAQANEPTAAITSIDAPLEPWRVNGLRLTAKEAFQFLVALPLSDFAQQDLAPTSAVISDDLRFWSHLNRWGLDLLARGKYLPQLAVNADGSGVAQWQVLLDSATDQERLISFANQMPTICRLYSDGDDALAVALPPPPKRLMTQFLNQILDRQIRQLGLRPEVNSTLKPWLAALMGPKAQLKADIVSQIAPNIRPWLAPLAQLEASIAQFRIGLTLIPPSDGAKDWQLEYGLQSINDVDVIVPAAVIWQQPVDQFRYADQVIQRPQETLLAGLGLASRIYSRLESSLQTPQPTHCVLDASQAYQFLREMAWRLRESGVAVILPPSLANRDGWANRLGLKVRATTMDTIAQRQGIGMQSLLDFEWELAIGGHSISRQEFDRLVALETPFVEINGEWVELRPQDIRAAQNFFKARQNQTQLSLEDALRLSSGDTQTIEKLPVVSFEASGSLQELVTNLTDNQSIAPLHPAHLNGDLRPYQARGVGWLAFLERWSLGACLADDMGLGKTLQLIAFVLHLQQEKALKQPILVVCPTSVLGNWEREVKRFAPSLTTLIHHGDKRPQGKTFAKAAIAHHIVITSYALIHRDLSTLKTVTWQGVVLDEAQNIKNPDAKQSQAVRQLDTQFRVALTGTPVENRLTELWSIMDFLNPNYLGPKNYFQRRFAIPIERYGDMTSLQSLRSLAQPFILRRLKSDKSIIQDLPEKQEINDFCGLTQVQADLYQHLVDQALEQIDASTGIQRRGMILGLLTKLKQVCNHAGLITGETAIDDSFRLQSGKVQRLEEMLDVALAEGDRALIFTQFAEWGKLLQQHLTQKMRRETLFLYGGSSKKQREAMVDRFQNDPQAPTIFILSLKAGGVGLNLTRANHVFHFDRWWNPAVENQATDRVFRIGQKRNVQVHKFICTGTLEEKIHDMIESKKALAEQVIGTGENWLTEMDTDQLRELLLLDRRAILGEEVEA
jgi:SNF2 family DNA or RNA helicase